MSTSDRDLLCNSALDRRRCGLRQRREIALGDFQILEHDGTGDLVHLGARRGEITPKVSSLAPVGMIATTARSRSGSLPTY